MVVSSRKLFEEQLEFELFFVLPDDWYNTSQELRIWFMLCCGLFCVIIVQFKKNIYPCPKPDASLANLCYRKTSSISHTKSQNFNVPCILLQLSWLNPLKPCVKLRMKM